MVPVFSRERFIKVLSLSGILASMFYVAHVVAGRLVWTDYNPITQPISDLTADSAISNSVASRVLTGYNFFNLLFCFALLVYFYGQVRPNKTFYTGLVLKAAAELLSVFGYK